MSELPSLFAATDRKTQVRRLIGESVPVLQRLAGMAKLHGLIAEDLRLALQDKGLVTGEEKDQRFYAWIPAAFHAADLVPTTRTRKPRVLKKGHGKPQRVFVAKEYARPSHGEAA